MDNYKLHNDLQAARFSAKVQCSLLFTLNVMALWFFIEPFINTEINTNTVKIVLMIMAISFFLIISRLSKVFTPEDYMRNLKETNRSRIIAKLYPYGVFALLILSITFYSIG